MQEYEINKVMNAFNEKVGRKTAAICALGEPWRIWYADVQPRNKDKPDFVFNTLEDIKNYVCHNTEEPKA